MLIASPLLEKRTRHYAIKLRNIKQYPSVVIGVEISHKTNIESSGKVPALLANKLKLNLELLGTINTKVNGNFLGCCAEVRASNKLLLDLAWANPTGIHFTKPLRPRTLQFVPTCKNCRDTFR